MLILFRDHQAILRQRQRESVYDGAGKYVPVVQGPATRRPPSHVVETCTPHVELRAQSRQCPGRRPRLAVVVRRLGAVLRHRRADARCLRETRGIPNCPDGQFIGPAKTTKIEEAFLTNVEKRLPNVRVTYARKTKYDDNSSAACQARSGNRPPRDSDRRRREPIADRSAVG